MHEHKTVFDRIKFARDSLANLISVFILGVSGIVINIIIARFYSASDLGVFNQTYAIYVLSSQVASLGIQISVLKHIAQYSTEEKTCNKIFTAAFILCFFSASSIVFFLFLVRGLLGEVLGSNGVFLALPYILLGVWCFAFNKLFMAILNGFESMKAYAVFSSFRGIGLLIGVVGAVALRIEGYKLPVIFSFAECLIFLPLYLYSKNFICFVNLGQCKKWIQIHLTFGIKSLGVGFITELNTRVDVLILGIFASDKIVGVYSMASMLIEGLAQIPFVFRRIFDPKLTKLIYQKRVKELQNLMKKGVLITFGGMVVIVGIAIVLFPVVITELTKNSDFQMSWKIFSILSVGAIFQCSYLPFSGLLVQGGYPGYNSILILLFCITNVILNFLLIPFYGIYGAAFATAFACIMFICYFKFFTLYLFKIKI
ncbi:MAG: oligosaccharide flippase family protein [Desulfobacula sp.]|nr:oligosaccharide flippase family protein [Desulfobacula sp.]